MKTSPYVRIKEKNKIIKEYDSQFKDIANLLGCQVLYTDIVASITEALQWKGSYMAAMVDNDSMRIKMGEEIQKQVDKVTFNLQLANKQLQAKVDNLSRIIDNKDYDLQKIKQKNQTPQKGFWDFVYKVFKIV